MKGHSFAIFCACLVFATPSAARNSNNDIVITAQETLPQWTKRISQDLDKKLYFPKMLFNQDPPQGMVKIAFHCSPAGDVADAAVIRSSQSVNIDRAALMSVRRLNTLHPLPQGIDHGYNFQAWIIYAHDPEMARMMTEQINHDLHVAKLDPHSIRISPSIMVAAR